MGIISYSWIDMGRNSIKQLPIQKFRKKKNNIIKSFACSMHCISRNRVFPNWIVLIIMLLSVTMGAVENNRHIRKAMCLCKEEGSVSEERVWITETRPHGYERGWMCWREFSKQAGVSVDISQERWYLCPRSCIRRRLYSREQRAEIPRWKSDTGNTEVF